MTNIFPEFDPRNRKCLPGCPSCLVAPHVTRHTDCFADSIESILGLPEKEEEQAVGLCFIAASEVGLGDNCMVPDEQFDAQYPQQT